MLRNSITIGRLLGIPIKIHTSWFLVFALVTWSLASGYFPPRYPYWSGTLYWTVGLATSLLFFVSVLLHELAHSLVARARGLPIRDIVLFIFGGVSELTEEPRAPRTEFTMALVGPLTSFALAALFALIGLLTRTTKEPLAALSRYLAYINLSLAAFNLIPGFPLDGGRVLRSILWAASKNLERATRWASVAGQLVAYLFILAGALEILRGRWADGLWIAFIGWFLDNAAQTAYRQVAVKQFLASHKVREAMTQACYPLAPEVTLETLVHDYILASGHRCFPVVSEGRVLGVVNLSLVRGIPRLHWPQVAVKTVMIPVEEAKGLSPDDRLWVALERMTSQHVDQLPVMESGQLVGMLMHDNILAFIRLRGELGI